MQYFLQREPMEVIMYPGMTYCILSRDLDFVVDMSALLQSQLAEVFVASSFDEYEALQAEGVIVEMLLIDPVFRLD
jgi:hypothetical protein